MLAVPLTMLFSVLVPSKMWYAPEQAIPVTIQADGKFALVLTTFADAGVKKVDPDTSAEVEGKKAFDLRAIFKAVSSPGTYVLYASPAGKPAGEFVGTPLVIQSRQSKRGVEGTIVTKVQPLRYAAMTTDNGPIKMVFYYDVAPNTVDNFFMLSEEGYYDGLTFHRIVPGFVIQGGDPKGDGSGGPGYSITAEFNDRKHETGVLSMARLGDPEEAPGVPPRAEYANSAGSQFFVCLDYEATKALDKGYTAFGKVIEGMEAVRAIAAVKLADERNGKPEKAPVIEKVQVKGVTAQDNPYATMLSVGK
jgi:peptidyl-prolyl cis-trans isomerase B (cyclophilin B)